MKKLINDPSRVVLEMQEGLVAVNPSLALLNDETVIVRSDLKAWREETRVAVISGGGAGHEPAHAGYVGQGMLTAAVSGDVFTSPSVDSILATIQACATSAGVLLVVKNYTGDRLNFGLAGDLARAEGIPVEMVVVADDASFERSDERFGGRRGLAGTVLVHKVIGAAAAAGLSLQDVKGEGDRAAAAVATMGVALSGCTVPAAGTPGFDLPAHEMEFGLGIHGERGIRRCVLAPADEIASQLTSRLVQDLALGAADRAVLMVNNLGGTPLMELAIMARRALRELQEMGVNVERAWCGTFLTAIDMVGCSFSIMKVDSERLARLDAPTSASAWLAIPAATISRAITRVTLPTMGGLREAKSPLGAPRSRFQRAALHSVALALLAAEPRLTALDQAVGDGDLGISMSRAARAIVENLDRLSAEPMAEALTSLSHILRRVIAGSSGPFYAAGLGRAAATLKQTESSLSVWAAAFESACDAIAELGGAARGDRTMLDALCPAAAAFRNSVELGASWIEAVTAAAVAAEQGAHETAQLMPRYGRSRYLGERALGSPDPGAEAAAVWLRAISATAAAHKESACI
jgi:dihydroxyacetone kinase